MNTKLITEPTVTVDDGFYAEARRAGLWSPTHLADLSPVPDEFVTEATARFFRRNPRLKDGKMLSDDGHALVSEWARGRAALANALAWYQAKSGQKVFAVNDFYGTDTNITSLFPAWIESEIQATLIATGLVPWLTFSTTAVGQTMTKCLYDSTAATERELRKISEGSDLPSVSLTLSDSTIVLYKYGRAIEASYEVIGNQSVDEIAHHISRIAQQVAVDETDAALSTLVGGDGTTAGAAESDSTDKDVATAGTVLWSDLCSWYLGMDEPYRIDKAVLGDTDLAQLWNMAEFKDTAMRTALAGAPGPLNPQYERWTGGVTGSSYVDRLIVGIDSRHALKRYTYGSFLQEQDKIIRRQTNLWTFSYWVGFRKFDTAACHVLDCNSAL